MLPRKLMPTSILLIAILTMIALHGLLPITKIIPTFWNLLGLLPLALGVWINLWTDHAFHQVQTTVKPYERPSTLIVYGWFSYTRNPMYLGFVLVLIGIAVLLMSLSPWIVIPAFILSIDAIYIPYEEQMLAKQFDSLWEGYKKSVRRWI